MYLAVTSSGALERRKFGELSAKLNQKRVKMIAVSQLKFKNGIRLRPIALPVEHGGWGLLLEPLMLGLLVAPSLAGLFLSLSALAAFLTRHPLKLAATDRSRNRQSARTVIAERFALLYLCLGSLFFVAAVVNARGEFWLPLVLAAPMMMLQLIFDSRGRSRALVAELSGSIAIAAFASAIAISGGWQRNAAFVLWIIMAARSVPTILYLRARLRQLHHKPASPMVAILAHVIALAITIVLAQSKMAPWLAVAAVTLLLLRALNGVRKTEKRVTAKMLGIREFIYGAVLVFAVVVGFRLSF
ncbi:MAG: prenyltransferase [Blastocatellia bacterium]|nr:MAG: prenyltransferase [Blastocatellia bacterium]